MPSDTRDTVIDFIHHWNEKAEIPATRLVKWIGVGESKYHDWRKRYGKLNEHNTLAPRDHWLEAWEKESIIRFFHEYPLEGYRRLSFMLLDRNVVCASPSSVYRVLHREGLLGRRWDRKHSSKGKGFVQPLVPHEHWHIDVSYLNICGTFYYLCSILDGASRFIVHWELRESMKETEIEIIIQRALEKFPSAKPRLISDNGPQFIAKDFKEFIRISGLTHVKTSPYYPQSNGKIERWHRTIKSDCIRPQTPLSLDDAQRSIVQWIDHYNNVRLHSTIGYITPKDKLHGKDKDIFALRDFRFEKARENRKLKRNNPLQSVAYSNN